MTSPAMSFNQGYSARHKIPSYGAGLNPTNQKAVNYHYCAVAMPCPAGWLCRMQGVGLVCFLSHSGLRNTSLHCER